GRSLRFRRRCASCVEPQSKTFTEPHHPTRTRSKWQTIPVPYAAPRARAIVARQPTIPTRLLGLTIAIEPRIGYAMPRFALCLCLLAACTEPAKETKSPPQPTQGEAPAATAR